MSDRVDHRVSGSVRFDNLVALREAGEAAIRAAGDVVTVDLSEVENGNSVAVALLMAWFREAEGQGKQLRFTGVPGELRDIVELSGLTEVLPVLGVEGAESPEVFPAEAGQ